MSHNELAEANAVYALRIMELEAEVQKWKAEAEGNLKSSARFCNMYSELRTALKTIRDATHTNAVTLRGMADLALKDW